MYPLPSALEPAQGVGQETTDPAGSSLSAYSVCLVGFFFYLSRATLWSALERFWTQWAPLVGLSILVPPQWL